MDVLDQEAAREFELDLRQDFDYYSSTGKRTLSSELSSVQNEITKLEDTWQTPRSPSSKI